MLLRIYVQPVDSGLQSGHTTSVLLGLSRFTRIHFHEFSMVPITQDSSRGLSNTSVFSQLLQMATSILTPECSQYVVISLSFEYKPMRVMFFVV